MPRKRTIRVRPPVGGLNRGIGFQNQPPFSTSDAKNVRPYGALEQRLRIASRPGLDAAFRTTPMNNTPVRMLASYGIQPADGQKYWADDFKAPTLGTVWNHDIGVSTTKPTIDRAKRMAVAGNAVTALAGRDALADLDTTEAYEFSVFIVPDGGENRGVYVLYGRLGADYDLTSTGGFRVTVDLDEAAPANVTHHDSGGTLVASQNSAGGFTISPRGGWLTLRVEAPTTVPDQTVIRVWFQDTLLLTKTMAGASTDAQNRLGFGMTGDTANFNTQIDSFEVVYQSSSDTNKRPRFPLVASQSGLLYRETFHREMIPAGVGDVTLIDDRPIRAVSRLGVLYMADHGDITHSGTDGRDDGAVDLLDSVAAPNWTTLGIDKDNEVVVVSDAVAPIIDGTYEIIAINAGNLQLTPNTFSSGAFDGTCSYEIQRGPKQYEFNPDTSTDALTAWVATDGKGSVPVGNRAIALYRDRLVLAVDGTGAIYFSRSGDPLDFDYGENWEDPLRAFALGTSTLAGRLPQPVTAIFSHSDDCLVIGTATQLWILRSDPAFGGALDNASQDVGILDVAAGTYAPNGEFIFMSRDGLYLMPNACGGAPIPLSRDTLPEELRDLNPDMVYVSLAYDVKARGVHIFLAYDAGSHSTNGDHWWFDFENKGFWLVEIDDDQTPFSAVQHIGDHAHDDAVIVGTRSGGLHRFHKYHYKDKTGSDIAISAFCDFGPINLGGSDMKGAVDSLTSILAADSGDVTWSVFVGDTAESVSRQTGTPFATGTWSAGANYREHTRAGGGAAMIRVEDNSEIPWAVEVIPVELSQRGRQRL